MVVYGGWSFYNNRLTSLKMSKKLYVFSTTRLVWEEIDGGGEMPAGRTDHAATVLGKSMVVFGGCKTGKEVTSEVLILDLEEFCWSKPVFTYTQSPCARVKTSFSAAFPASCRNNQSVTAFNYNEHIEGSDQHFGFYMFGGLSYNGLLLNDLWVLRNSPMGFMWNKIEAAGAPSARHSHTSTYVNGMFVIFGGKTSPSPSTDIGIFLIEKNKWYQPRILEEQPLTRHKHCSALLGKRLLIFGGTNPHSFLNSQMHVLETDQIYTSRYSP